MTTAAASPHGLPAHNGTSFGEDEDQVVFKTPSEKNGTPNVSAFRQSSFPPASQRSFGDSAGQPNGLTKVQSPQSAGASWSMSGQGFNDADPSWEVGEGNSRITDNAVEIHTGGTGVLAPAAEIKDQGQPHSRQSSAGDSSSFDSPALPTPGNNVKVRNGAASDKPLDGHFSPQNGYQYGYDGQDLGIHQANGINGMLNGPMSPPIPGQGMYPMSPPMGAAAGLGAFSPQMMLPGVQDGRQGFGTGADGFSVNYGMQQGRMNGRPAMTGRPSNGAANAAAYPTLNGQQQAAANGAGFPYGSPPNQSAMAYNPGLMSPTITSPTINPYSPIHAPTPYSPYAGNPQALPGAGLYDIMSPMSPPATAAMLNRGGQVQGRGHGYSASQPAALRDNTQGMGGVRGNQGRSVPQGQAPRGVAPNQVLNHAHSMSMSQVPYSPQLTGIPYGPMSPPPFPGYYPQVPPQQPTLSPEILQAMAGLAISAGAGNPANAAAYNPQVQSALHGLQQDPAVLALIQQGGGPSANNRKLGLYKTELCRSWEEKGSCKYGEKCQFAHGDTEQRRVERHPKYKTEICRTFWVSGSCPYGKRCCFIHTELPGGAASGAGGANGEGQRSTNTPNNVGTQNDRAPTDGRARSMSTNSDPNEHTSSLLARISARAQANNSSSPVNGTTRSGDDSPTNAGVPESVIAGAIARAYSAYGMPAGAAAIAVQNHQVTATEPTQQTQQTQQQQMPSQPPTPQQAPPPQAPSPSGFSGFPNRNTSTPSGGLGGGHHRVSASMDFGRDGRNLGSELSGLGSGLGHRHQVSATGLDTSGVLTRMSHKRNPSASSVVPSTSYSIPGLSRTPISGQSTPFGGANESSSVRGVAVSSSLLDPSPW